MRTSSSTLVILLVGLIAPAPFSAMQFEQPPIVRVKLSKPDESLRQLLSLFDGAKASSPAAALSAWKRASKEPNRLGKPLEALIAALNPSMVDELKTLQDAELSVWFDPQTGQPRWSAILPRDDGTFSALASAFVLSGGASEAFIDGKAVDRLGGPDSPRMMKLDQGTILAIDRAGLKKAIDRLDGLPDPFGEMFNDNILSFVVHPGALRESKSLLLRRVNEGLRPQRVVPPTEGLAMLGVKLKDAELIAFLISTDFDSFRFPRFDPTWLDWIPADRAMVGFALATNPSSKSWNALFRLADRIEKIDPSRAEVASTQIRLDLLGRLVGLRLETDVLLHLKGLTGWVRSDDRAIDGALVALHLDDQAAAERIVKNIKSWPGSRKLPDLDEGRTRSLGEVEGRPLRISRVDRSVVITWGEGVLEASMLARDNLDRSAGPKIRELGRFDHQVFITGGLWPGRVPGLWPAGSPLAQAMAEAAPIVWNGSSTWLSGINGAVVWPQLDVPVKRFLELIPLDPPTDRSSAGPHERFRLCRILGRHGPGFAPRLAVPDERNRFGLSPRITGCRGFRNSPMNMTMKKLGLLAMTLLVSGMLLGCEEKGPVEKAGAKIDKAGENVKESLDPRGPGEKAGAKLDNLGK